MGVLIALAVGLVLADSSVVTLALPEILREFDASVGAVAWVLIAFNLALALAAVPGARAARGRARPAFLVGTVLFAAASALCAAAPSLGVLVAGRVAQGVAGSVVVAAALELLVALSGRDRAVARWAAAGVLGAAVGPAAGGLLTEAFSWQAMFALQAPVALVALAGARRAGGGGRQAAAGAQAAPSGAQAAPSGAQAAPSGVPSAPLAVPSAPSGAQAARPALAPLAALAFVSAALAAALFLLVLMLIEGWRHSPAEAAAAVTALPLATLVAGRSARGRAGLAPAAAGALLVAGGLAALGLLPGAAPGWTIAPQLAIGAGLGLALAALTAMTLGAHGLSGPASWTIAARHAGIVAGLLVLTPLFTADLDRARAPAERAGLARLLDAPLALDVKLDLARALDARIDAADGELPDLGPAFDDVAVPVRDRPALAELRDGLGDELDRAGTDAFSRSFLAAALLAALGLVPLAVLHRRRRRRTDLSRATNGSRLTSGAPLAVAVPGAAALALALVAVQAGLGGGTYEPTEVADPCAARERPAGERLGETQLAVLAALDGAACRLGTSREETLLTLLERDRPGGVSDRELASALRAGIRRAQEEGALSAAEAAGLLIALSTRGTDAILGLLLGPR